MKIKSSKIVHSNRPRAFRRVFRCQPNAYNIRFTVIYVVFLPIQQQHTHKHVPPVEIYTPRRHHRMHYIYESIYYNVGYTVR